MDEYKFDVSEFDVSKGTALRRWCRDNESEVVYLDRTTLWIEGAGDKIITLPRVFTWLTNPVQLEPTMVTVEETTEPLKFTPQNNKATERSPK